MNNPKLEKYHRLLLKSKSTNSDGPGRRHELHATMRHRQSTENFTSLLKLFNLFDCLRNEFPGNGCKNETAHQFDDDDDGAICFVGNRHKYLLERAYCCLLFAPPPPSHPSVFLGSRSRSVGWLGLGSNRESKHIHPTMISRAVDWANRKMDGFHTNWVLLRKNTQWQRILIPYSWAAGTMYSRCRYHQQPALFMERNWLSTFNWMSSINKTTAIHNSWEAWHRGCWNGFEPI